MNIGIRKLLECWDFDVPTKFQLNIQWLHHVPPSSQGIPNSTTFYVINFAQVKFLYPTR
jgi:hypothetical protein